MGQGQDSSLAGGYSGDSGGAPYTGYSPPGGGGGDVSSPSGPSFWDQVGQAFSDPETLKAFANIAKAHAGMTQAQTDLPPQTRRLIQAGTREFSKARMDKAAADANRPYLGDIDAFRKQIPPEVAQLALMQLGIPGLMRR